MSDNSKPEVLYEVEEPEFFYSASLRIFGDNVPFSEIESGLGLQATKSHRKGERRGPRSPVFKHDMWTYTTPVPEEKHLSEHLGMLWNHLQPSVAYLRELKKKWRVDVFCGFRTNCQVTGIELDYRLLEIFTELEIPFGLSIITLE
jgi:hypothetical protein